MKKILLTTLCILLCVSMTACGLGSIVPVPTEDTKLAKVNEFYELVCESQALLDEVADDIYSNWHAAIYKDKFNENINLAIASALSDNKENIEEIERLDGEITVLFKEVRDTEQGPQIKAVMSAYSDYYELVVNVSGSFNSYSADKESLKKELASALKKLSFEI